MFESIFARFQKRYIKLNIDPLLHSSLPIKYRSAQTRFKLNLFNFVLAIGLSRSVRTTNKIKFADAADFVERFVKNDNDELIVSINDVDVDDKIKIAEHIGEGLSIIIAEQLYDIQRSNISKIKRKKNESKPDYEGYSRNLKIVWEAKGSTNTINQRIIRHAKNQKKRVPANIAFASFANLIPHCITEVTIEDPPTFLP
ncbi:MAG: hypothetical protein NTY20_04245, partial [Candidatus Aenigmarchaeota archaeon]|nr:hypothetical protein [Candidatus Aenigmarchaeota archaeon]